MSFNGKIQYNRNRSYSRRFKRQHSFEFAKIITVPLIIILRIIIIIINHIINDKKHKKINLYRSLIMQNIKYFLKKISL